MRHLQHLQDDQVVQVLFLQVLRLLAVAVVFELEPSHSDLRPLLHLNSGVEAADEFQQVRAMIRDWPSPT